MFCAVCAVVVQTDGLESVALFQPARVMLETEFGAVVHGEVRALAVQPLEKKTQSVGCLGTVAKDRKLTQMISPSVPLILWMAHASRAEIR